jgi:mannose-6-phosphate isomerase-like protein (cupin superfamily)
MPRIPKAINIAEKLALFSDHWSPRIIAQLNDNHVKLAKVEGRFAWHKHDDTDELFLVIKGTLNIDIRDKTCERTIVLSQGELHVVPKGLEHAPHAQEECHILMIEPAGTLNTGDADQDGTTGEWI